MSFILSSSDAVERFQIEGGGKATHLAKLTQAGFTVPPFFCITSAAFKEFVLANHLGEELTPQANLAQFASHIEALFVRSPLSAELESEILAQIKNIKLSDRFLAVRSSGLDEDSVEHSFAGQFSSYLFQKGEAAVFSSLKRCWASAYSERALAYRIERGLALTDIRMGVVVQLMVHAESSGVAFSRNPIHPLDRAQMIISSVWGLGEGLVSGELDADHFEVDRQTNLIHATVVDKPTGFYQAPQGGLVKKEIAPDQVKLPSLSEAQVLAVKELCLSLEQKLGRPQDCEWAFENGVLFCVQTRPVTTLPPDEFFDSKVVGLDPILWDNSNIVESYSGVTSPLTFSVASPAYRQAYIQFCEVMGVPRHLIRSHELAYRNLLGLVRGRIYYNLINWYRLVILLPGAGSNKEFMETMMGVKQGLKPEIMSIFDFMKNPPRYSFFRKLAVAGMTIYRFIRIDKIVHDFQSHFSKVYHASRKIDFRNQSLNEQLQHYSYLVDTILSRWQAPLINDYLCMIFFGLLKKFTVKWIQTKDGSLQNDLLCGEGDLESTMPTKMLMKIAETLDQMDSAFKAWLISTPPSAVWAELKHGGKSPEVLKMVDEYLDRYGFRCVNELKLEEPDLHDDPSFAINAVASYVRMKAYSTQAMEERERLIRDKAEAIVYAQLHGLKRAIYFWILRQARKAVKSRESLRFDRTKIYGVIRHLFRGVGANLLKLGVLKAEHDVFYLTTDEIFAFSEGRPVTVDLGKLVELRRQEFAGYRKSVPPPDRFITYGAAGIAMKYPMVLADSDLLRNETPLSDDPNVLIGTPCCPGVIEGVVRVVREIKESEGMNGEILVTERTDPGWVPLYPSCSGILIERGSLLSHSAVVARELGIPTIVGISGGLLKKLKTGQRVRIDAGIGEVRILPDKKE